MGVICGSSPTRRKNNEVKEEHKEGEEKIITLHFKDQEGNNIKNISISEKKTLREAIERYQKSIGKSNSKIIKAIHANENMELSLNKKLNELGIDYVSDIYVHFDK